jgi:hypothetical protein
MRVNEVRRRKYLFSIENSWNRINSLDPKHLKNIVSEKTFRDEEKFIEGYVDRLQEENQVKRRRQHELKTFRANLLSRMQMSSRPPREEDDDSEDENFRLMERQDMSNLVIR